MLSEALQCPICLQDYNLSQKVPKILPRCGHTICSRCLNDIMRQKEPQCPFDNRKFINQIDEKNPFPINQSLRKVLDDDLDLAVCQIHHEKLKLVCLDENCQVCAFCVLYGEHKDHKVRPLKDIKADVDIKVKKMITCLQNNDDYYNEVDHLLSTQRTDLINTVNTRFQEFELLISRRRDDFLLQIDTFFEHETVRLSRILGQNSLFRRSIMDRISYYKEAVKHKDLLNIIEQDISSFTTKLDFTLISKHIKEFSQSSNDVLKFFEEEIGFQIDSFAKITCPTKSFLEHITTLFPEDVKYESLKIEPSTVAVTLERSFAKVNTDVHMKLRLTESVLEITASKIYKAVSVDVSSFKNIQKVIFNADHFTFSREDVATINTILSRETHIESVKIDAAYQEDIGERALVEFLLLLLCKPKGLKEIDINVESSKVGNLLLVELSEKILSQAPQLQRFKMNMYNTNLNNKSIQSFSNALPQFTPTIKNFSLNLGRTSVTEEMLLHLPLKMQTVEFFELNLSSTNVTDRIIEVIVLDMISYMKKLNHFELWLCNTKITDKGALQLFINLPNTKKLVFNFQSTSVSDISLEVLLESQLLNIKDLSDFDIYLDDTNASKKIKIRFDYIKDQFQLLV